jgi:crossover junction endodeoxyribonuclease RusA
MTIDLTLPWPPSVNGYWRAISRGGHVTQIISQHGRLYRGLVKVACLGCHRVGAARVSVTMTFRPSNNRRFDLDNFAKAIGDALTHAAVWEDDSQVDELHLIRGKPQAGYGLGRVHVTIEVLP